MYITVRRRRLSLKAKALCGIPVLVGVAFGITGMLTESQWMLLASVVLLFVAWRIFVFISRKNENEAITESLKRKGIVDVRVFHPCWGFTGSRSGYYVRGHFWPNEDYHEPTKDLYQLSVRITVDHSHSL